MEKWSRAKGNIGKTKVMQVEISIHCKLLVNILVQYAGKVLETQSSVVDVRFGFTKCSGIPGKLVEGPDFRCRRCLGNAWVTDGRP